MMRHDGTSGGDAKNTFNKILFGIVSLSAIFPLVRCDVSEIYRPTHERDELAEAEGLCLYALATPTRPGFEREAEVTALLGCVVLPQLIRDSYRD